MIGIILAGGLGKRLQPLTHNENKHYLPVYSKRMIELPLTTLCACGIKDVLIVLGGQKPGLFVELLKDGAAYGLNQLRYTYQDGNGGVADALMRARPMVEAQCGDHFMVILGDNYFETPPDVTNCNRLGARIFLQKVSDPWFFGIADLDNGQVISIEEKPSNPKSDLAILGAYIFDWRLWRYLQSVEPSVRGELEITDLLKIYMLGNSLEAKEYTGYWSDMGTFDSWIKVATRLAEKQPVS